MSTQPIAGNQSFTGVVNHAGQVPHLDVAELDASTADIQDLLLSDLTVDDLTVNGDATFTGTTATFEEGTKVLLDGSSSLGKLGTLDLVAGGAHCVKWTPGALGVNTFDPPIQAQGGDGTYGSCQLDRTSNSALINTGGSATNQMPANAISAQIPGTANAVTFEVDSSSQTLFVTIPAKTANSTFEITSFATVKRDQSGTAGIPFTLECNNGTGVTGTIPTVTQASSEDGSWTMQTSGTLVVTAPTGAKQALLESVVKASPPSPWIQGPDAVEVTTGSHMNVQQTV